MGLDSERLAKIFPDLCARPLLNEIEKVALHAKLPEGATICHQGQECTHLALVLKGSARVYQLAESGREITLYRVGPGEACILTASCIMSQRSFPAVAVCGAETEAALIPAARVDEWMGFFPRWRQFIWQLMADRLSHVLCLLEEVTFRRMDQRIGAYLLEKTGMQTTSHLSLTHQVIADDLGTSREVVSRILKDLQERGAVRLSRGQITVQRETLQKAMNQCD